jgi:hypothetical protein
MIVFCACCFTQIPAEESDCGGYGHICAECGWEQDSVENCLELAAWCEEKYGEVPCGLVEGCTCHTSRVGWVACGYSAANGTTIRQARLAYYARSPLHVMELIARALTASMHVALHSN